MDYDYADYSEITSPAWELYEEVTECLLGISEHIRENNLPDISVQQGQRLCGWVVSDMRTSYNLAIRARSWTCKANIS